MWYQTILLTGPIESSCSNAHSGFILLNKPCGFVRIIGYVRFQILFFIGIMWFHRTGLTIGPIGPSNPIVIGSSGLRYMGP